MKIKVLIFLILCCAARQGIAQSFSLYYRDTKLADNAVIARTGTSDTLEMTTWLTIRNEAATSKQIQAKKTEISMVPGTACSICWAGYCYPTQTYQSEYPLELAPGVDSTGCFAHFITGGTIGASIVRWTYYDFANPADSVTVVIQYITYPAGINDPRSKDRVNVTPNPADREVTFRFPAVTTHCSITLCTLSGRTMLQESAAGADGVMRLDTSGLPAGIYLYTLLSGGKLVGTGKIVISRYRSS